MSWEAVGAIGEVFGAVAVFVTLGYLAIQVRQARAETRRALSQGRIAANRELIALELQDENLAALVKADEAFDSASPPIVTILMEQGGLTRMEAQRVFLIEVARWNYRAHVITHADDLPEIERTLFDRATRTRAGSKLGKLIYETHWRDGLHPDVVKYVENVMSERNGNE